jgi:hypothetical protein
MSTAPRKRVFAEPLRQRGTGYAIGTGNNKADLGFRKKHKKREAEASLEFAFYRTADQLAGIV